MCTCNVAVQVDMDHELVVHGWTNLLAGSCGGLQNYVAYSNSLLYWKCGGGGRVNGCLLAAITAFFFVYGPDSVAQADANYAHALQEASPHLAFFSTP